jgi:type I restriction enzyme, S subunit
VEWLGKIPAHWGIGRLKRTIRSCQNGLWGGEPDGINDIACIRVADFDRFSLRVKVSNPTLRSIDMQARSGRLLKPGDLLLEKSGGGEKQPVGAVVLYDKSEPAICSNFIARMSAAEGFDPLYLAYLHAAAYTALLNTRSIKQSTGIQNLDAASYFDEPADFPTLPEQVAIAAFLDRVTQEVAVLISKKERLIELLQEKRAATIAHAVTQGLGLRTLKKNAGVESLGEIPAHWSAKRLWQLTPNDRRIMYGIVLPGPHVDEGVPIVKGGDVSASRLRLSRLNRTAVEIESHYVRSRLRGGDLVYAIRGSIGEVAMVPEELCGANLTQDAARISYTRETDGQWLLYALQSRAVFAQLEAGALGATIRGINIRDLKRAVLPVPPKDEQKEIAAFLNTATGQIDALIGKVREAIDRLREFRTALISAAVTGKIDVREEVG